MPEVEGYLEGFALRVPSDISGLLVVDKPKGPTSFDVVARVRRLTGAAKAGHTGTLDPLATGVLVVLLGEAVKLQQFLSAGDKAYEALVAFGAATTTQDAEGEVVARADPSKLEEGLVRKALSGFTGHLEQTPPMFSAIRVKGRRLHEAARAGEEVERPSRRVWVEELRLLEMTPPVQGLVHARIEVRCGKGTYVRTLMADLGARLGLPAHLAALRRLAAGPFTLSEALSLERAEELAQAPPGIGGRILPLAEALRGFPMVRLSTAQARDLGHGKCLELEGTRPGLCGALDPDGQLRAVCEVNGGRVRPLRVLHASR
ncbi:MAG TPA: tRNA pseudouridine(55) synthase TruB [Anaeromyxobacteraceae bacterium]|nr:tRNA pseudouridine(55) synthase TruB [Anaeromyxobacteraceae bacterium]